MKEVGFEEVVFESPHNNTGMFMGTSPTDTTKVLIDVSIMNSKKLNSVETNIMASDIRQEVLKKIEQQVGSQSEILERLHDGDFFKKWLVENLNTEEGLTVKKINQLIKNMQINNNMWLTNFQNNQNDLNTIVANGIWSGIDKVQNKQYKKNKI